MDKDRILALDTETTGVGPNAEIRSSPSLTAKALCG